jgi:hypothetical protein
MQINTVKLVYNDHSRDTKFVAVVDRWSLFKISFMLLQGLKLGIQNSGRWRQVVAIRRWSLVQLWLYTINESLKLELYSLKKWKMQKQLKYFWSKDTSKLSKIALRHFWTTSPGYKILKRRVYHRVVMHVSSNCLPTKTGLGLYSIFEWI